MNDSGRNLQHPRVCRDNVEILLNPLDENFSSSPFLVPSSRRKMKFVTSFGSGSQFVAEFREGGWRQSKKCGSRRGEDENRIEIFTPFTFLAHLRHNRICRECVPSQSSRSLHKSMNNKFYMISTKQRDAHSQKICLASREKKTLQTNKKANSKKNESSKPKSEYRNLFQALAINIEIYEQRIARNVCECIRFSDRVNLSWEMARGMKVSLSRSIITIKMSIK